MDKHSKWHEEREQRLEKLSNERITFIVAVLLLAPFAFSALIELSKHL